MYFQEKKLTLYILTMPLYKINKESLEPISRKKWKLEKELQKLTENSLEKIYGLRFISSEFQINNLRIDSLAYDNETNSFVIIEYKRGRSFSIIDQGFAYLSLMLNNKADFILEYNEKNKNNLKRKDVDWSQSRIIFIADRFTEHQKNAINFKDLPIELWEAMLFENNQVYLNPIIASKTTESINTITKLDKNLEKVSKEIKKYTVDDHFKKGWVKTKEIFNQMNERILETFPNLEISPQKYYIGYKLENKVIFSFRTFKSKLRLSLNRVKPENFNDPDKKLKYIKNSFKYYHKHISEYELKDEDDIDYGMYLIKQIYRKSI